MEHAARWRRLVTMLSALSATLVACSELDEVEDSASRSGAVQVSAIDLDTPWVRHAIVAGSATFRGADAVHVDNIDPSAEDDDLDVVGVYEQGDRITVSLNPGDVAARGSWGQPIVLPSTGSIDGPEDAIFADVDRDGRKDVIVGAEAGKMVTVFFAPPVAQIDQPGAWVRMNLQVNGMRAMRVAHGNVTGGTIPEIVVGGKETDIDDAWIGHFELTNLTVGQRRLASSWTYTEIQQVGWVMQLMVLDVEGDGDRDIVYTDRESIEEGMPPVPPGSDQGLRWLESTPAQTPKWVERPISTSFSNHKWFDLARWDADNDLDIADCRSDVGVHEQTLWLNDGGWASWTPMAIPVAVQGDVGQCQHITFANIDNAGPLDLGISYSNAGNDLSGIIWLHNAGTAAAPVWERGEIGGIANGNGIKFDNLVWSDIDEDGDLDAVTSEQHEPAPPQGPGLGVIWYENPLI
jgi:hypothetical protein